MLLFPRLRGVLLPLTGLLGHAVLSITAFVVGHGTPRAMLCGSSRRALLAATQAWPSPALPRAGVAASSCRACRTVRMGGTGFGRVPEPPRREFDRRPSPDALCACRSGRTYKDCCMRYHDGEDATDTVSFMRSRYTAYAYRLPEYIMATTFKTHPDKKKPKHDWKAELLGFCDNYEFDGVDVGTPEQSPESPNMQLLSFTAGIKAKGEGGARLDFTERSVFVHRGGKWWYARGDLDYEPSVTAVPTDLIDVVAEVDDEEDDDGDCGDGGAGVLAYT